MHNIKTTITAFATYAAFSNFLLTAFYSIWSLQSLVPGLNFWMLKNAAGGSADHCNVHLGCRVRTAAFPYELTPTDPSLNQSIPAHLRIALHLWDSFCRAGILAVDKILP